MTRLIATLAGLLVALLAVAAVPAGARTVDSGVITVGKGAGPLALGMSRAQVIARLGRPLYENSNGYMQYARTPTIFDVYRDGGAHSSRVRMLSISSRGPRFRLSDGNRIFTRGGLARLSRRYGTRLKFYNSGDTGPYYEIVSKLHRRQVLTVFFVDRHALSATVIQIFILFG